MATLFFTDCRIDHTFQAKKFLSCFALFRFCHELSQRKPCRPPTFAGLLVCLRGLTLPSTCSWVLMWQPAIRKTVSSSHHNVISMAYFRLSSCHSPAISFSHHSISLSLAGSVKIVVHRKPSTTDTIRKNSEPRILSQADLRFAQSVERKVSETKIAARPGPVDYIPAADDREIDQDPVNVDDKFEYSHGITSAEADKRFGIYGPNQLPEKIIPKVRFPSLLNLVD